MNHPEHHVHGLAGNDMPPDWPPLTAAELARVLDAYPALEAPRHIAWHSPRPLSTAALVDTRAGRVFVKRQHASVRSAATLGEEHAFATWLRGRGLPVPALLANASGATTTASGDWTYEIHTPARGLDLYRDTPSWMPPQSAAHARRAGVMLGRLHQAARGYAAAQRTTHLLVARSELLEAADPVAALAAQLPERPGLAAYLADRPWQAELAAAIAPFHAGVHTALRALPRLWTHGDWHVSNLFWSTPGEAADVTAVLDFGLAARSFALFDLATAIERNAIAWLAPEHDRSHPAIARALIAGYRETCPLTHDDLRLLAGLLPIVHVDFAISEVDYFMGVTHSRAHAGVAWDTFLRGHAAWFRSVDGRHLLDAVRSA